MDYKRLGKRIREERLRLNLTQAQLAESIDISNTYMGAIKAQDIFILSTNFLSHIKFFHIIQP